MCQVDFILFAFFAPDAGTARVLNVSTLILSGEIREKTAYVPSAAARRPWFFKCTCLSNNRVRVTMPSFQYFEITPHSLPPPTG